MHMHHYYDDVYYSTPYIYIDYVDKQVKGIEVGGIEYDVYSCFCPFYY